jgi:von Willebrand factor type A domain
MFSAINGDRPNVQNVAIIISDGAASIDRQLTVPYAVSARNNGVFIVCVGVGSLVDKVMLTSMASPPTNSSVFLANSGADLPNLRDAVYMTTGNGMCLSSRAVGIQSTNG